LSAAENTGELTRVVERGCMIQQLYKQLLGFSLTCGWSVWFAQMFILKMAISYLHRKCH